MELNGFKIYEVLPKIYQIQDIFGACASLIIGTKKAVLFDTMNGIGNLKSVIETLTNVPIIVINSHGHFDHVGGNHQFQDIYLNKNDWNIFKKNYFLSYKKNKDNDYVWIKTKRERMPRLLDIEEKTIIKIGGRTLRVLSLGGHTKGSIGLLLEEEKILFAGDAFTPQMCLFFPESLSVQEYQKMILRIWNEKFDRYIL